MSAGGDWIVVVPAAEPVLAARQFEDWRRANPWSGCLTDADILVDLVHSPDGGCLKRFRVRRIEGAP